MSSRPGPLTLLAFALVVLIGGTNFVAVRLSNRELAPSFGAGIRFTFASLLLFAIVVATRTALPHGRALLGTIGYGSLQFFVAYAFVYWGLQHAPAALAGVLFGTVPLFTLVLAVIHRVERFRWRALAGAAIAIAGVAVMAWSPDNARVPIIAVVALFLSVLGASEATVLVKQLPPIHPFALNAVAMAAGGPLLFALSLVTGEEWSLPQRAATWWTLAFLIPIGSVLLFVLFVFVVHRWTASGASYQFVLLPVVSALMGALIADEPLRASIALGGGLVIAGTYVGAFSGRQPATPPVPTERAPQPDRFV